MCLADRCGSYVFTVARSLCGGQETTQKVCVRGAVLFVTCFPFTAFSKLLSHSIATDLPTCAHNHKTRTQPLLLAAHSRYSCMRLLCLLTYVAAQYRRQLIASQHHSPPSAAASPRRPPPGVPVSFLRSRAPPVPAPSADSRNRDRSALW